MVLGVVIVISLAAAALQVKHGAVRRPPRVGLWEQQGNPDWRGRRLGHSRQGGGTHLGPPVHVREELLVGVRVRDLLRSGNGRDTVSATSTPSR